mgnify:CR=1 FL=1
MFPWESMKNVVGRSITRYARAISPVVSTPTGYVMPVFVAKALAGRVKVGHGDSNKRYSTVGIFLEYPLEGWHFLKAGRAPRGPEVQYHHLATEFGQLERLSVQPS